MIPEHIQDILSMKKDLKEFVKESISKISEYNNELKFMNVISEELALRQVDELNTRIKNGEKPPLAGLIISVKDNICVKGVESTAGSAILKGYKPVFDATVIKKLKNAGCIIVGKTSMDEFGFGAFNVNVGKGYEIPLNPIDKERTTGGSSGGSGAITAKLELPHVSIAESTGGSIETPASFCGVIGFCPTYGRISRFGLISFANSLDKIGIISKKADDIETILPYMSGKDEKDPTSLKQTLDFKKTHSKFRVGLIKETMEALAPEIKEAMEDTIKKLKDKGFVVEEVTMPLTYKYDVAVYYIIATSEASTNLAKYCGLRYGQQGDPKGKSFNEYFIEIRSKYFNNESKRRIMLGTFARMAGYRDAYYLRTTKIRTKIIKEFKELFGKYDVLLSPTMPILPPRIDEVLMLSPVETYSMDRLTIAPNLAGIPHASVPIARAGRLPIGMMAMTNHYEEKKLIDFLKIVEELN
ncbi:MAG: aspartyl-tRNA(Asn)/glutamyl-tRNA(Gln) amidotransferase subunit [Candidatus Woesearchaeota archaeon]|nr:aspartyl-tRNA(Asn)/glutamyl-tRNA(Gln) amidotransferase subunit [Candidatus Woesearchaeota archaeon]